MQKDGRARALLPVIVVLFWFAQYIYIPFQTPFLTSIGVSAGLIGVIIGAYGISQMVMRLPVGLMADHVGRHKAFILLGGLFAGAASLLRVLFYNGIGFLLGNLFSGLASAMWISFMVRYTGFYSPEEQQKATARIILYNNAGMLAGFVCGTLLYGRTSMRLLCLLSLLAGGIAALLAAFMEHEDPSGDRPGIGELLPICLNRRLIFFSLLTVVQQGVQMATTMSFTSQVLQGLGASDAVIGASSIFYMLSAVGFACLAASRAVIRMGPRRVIPMCFGVLTAYCLLVPVVGSVPAVFALQMLPGVSTGLLFSTLTAQAMAEVPPHQKSTAMGFFQAVYALGMTLFPIFTGRVAGQWGMSSAYFMLAAVAVLAGLIALWRIRAD